MSNGFRRLCRLLSDSWVRYVQGPMVSGIVCIAVAIATLCWKGGSWLIEFYWFCLIVLAIEANAEARRWRKVAEKAPSPDEHARIVRKVGQFVFWIGLIVLAIVYLARREEVLKLLIVPRENLLCP